MRYFAFFSFFLVQSPTVLFSQEYIYEIAGQVVNDKGEPLSAATVSISVLQNKIATITDDSGHFLFKKLCAGTYMVNANYVGHKSLRIEVQIPSQHQIKLVLSSVQLLEDVVVTDHHHTEHGLAQVAVSLQAQDLERLRGKSLGEMVKQLPGVNALATGPSISKPVIQGLSGQRILILNNGVKMEGQQWGIEHAPEVDPFIAENIEVVKGAETVRYGADAMGGVIILSPTPLKKTEKFGGELNLVGTSNGRGVIFSSLLKGPLYNTRNNTSWNWQVQGTINRTGDYHAAKYNLSNTGVQEANASAAVAYHNRNSVLNFYLSTFNTTIGILRSAHTGNLTDFQQSIESEKPWYVERFTYSINNPKQNIHHHLFKTKLTTNLSTTRKFLIQYAFQYNNREEYDIRRGSLTEKPALSLNLISNTAEISLEQNKNNKSSSVGINTSLKLNTNKPDLGIKPLLPQYDQFNIGLYKFEKIRLSHWLFEWGVRYDYQYLLVSTFDKDKNLIKPDYHFHYGAGSLGASYYLNGFSRIINQFSISGRPPHVSELFSEGLHHSAGAIEEGLLLNGSDWNLNSTVRNEYAYKWNSTYQFEKEKVNFELSGYINRINNFITLNPQDTRLTIRGYFPVFAFTQTDVVLWGLDASVKWNISKFLIYSGKASYLEIEDVKNNDRIVNVPPPQMEHSLSVHGKVGNTYNSFITLRIPTFFQQTKSPRTLYPIEVPTNTSNKNFDFMPAPSGYTLINLELGLAVPVHHHALLVSFSVENLMNKAYRNYMNRMRYFADETGFNLALRLSYKFYNNNE